MNAFVRVVALSFTSWVGVFGQSAATSLESTLDLKERFQHGVSLMWSPCGQAAWDELRAYHKVAEIEMTPRSHTAEVLNAFKWERDKVLPSGTVIFAGDDSEAFRKQIRDDLRKRCGSKAAEMIGPYVPPGPVGGDSNAIRIKSALIVSAFARVLRFPGSFTDDAAPKTFLNSSGRECRTYGFGTSGAQSESYGDSVRVLDDDLKGRFCLRLKLAGEGQDHQEFLVLLRDASLLNLDGAIGRIRALIDEPRQPERIVESAGQKLIYTDRLETNEILWIPELHAALSTDFQDLVGKQYLRQGGFWWQIREAQQLLNFRLNHNGALATAVFKIAPDFLTSTGSAAGASATAPRAHYKKVFIFDKPFVASFWREGAEYPYLACWVDGPEMLVEKK